MHCPAAPRDEYLSMIHSLLTILRTPFMDEFLIRGFNVEKNATWTKTSAARVFSRKSIVLVRAPSKNTVIPLFQVGIGNSGIMLR